MRHTTTPNDHPITLGVGCSKPVGCGLVVVINGNALFDRPQLAGRSRQKDIETDTKKEFPCEVQSRRTKRVGAQPLELRRVANILRSPSQLTSVNSSRPNRLAFIPRTPSSTTFIRTLAFLLAAAGTSASTLPAWIGYPPILPISVSLLPFMLDLANWIKGVLSRCWWVAEQHNEVWSSGGGRSAWEEG